MANALLQPHIVLMECGHLLTRSLGAVACEFRDVELQPGDFINTIQHGRSTGGVTYSHCQPLEILRIDTELVFDDKDLTRSIDDFSAKILAGRVEQMAHMLQMLASGGRKLIFVKPSLPLGVDWVERLHYPPRGISLRLTRYFDFQTNTATCVLDCLVAVDETRASIHQEVFGSFAEYSLQQD